MRRAAFLVCLALSAPALAQAPSAGWSDSDILESPRGFAVESVRLRFTHFDQDGHGYQSQAERATATTPGREQVTVEQPQVEIVARQGKATHRLWVPVDVVTAASPDALDAVSTASRTNEAATFDLSTRYHQRRDLDWLLHAAFHIEEPFRSWALGFGAVRSFADDNATFAFTFNQVIDWLDRFNIFGTRLGRGYRSTTNANLSLTQLLSPTTVGYLGYSVTVQVGELGNTWNAVPIAPNMLDGELLPRLRHRHAFVGRLAQSLPWRGILKASYRFYVDDWGILAHTIEAQLYQRFGRWFYLRGNYRFHHQSGASFFTTLADKAAPLRTADSDLAPFDAHSGGVLAAVSVRLPRLRDFHVEMGYERYVRSNDLAANIYTCALGFLF